MSRARVLSAVAVALSCSGALAAQQAALSVDEAVKLAQANHPELRRLAAEVEAAKARLGGAARWLAENPTLSASSGPRSSPVGDSRDESLELSQPIEIGGQRRARIEAAEAALAESEARLGAGRVEVSAAVIEAFGRALGSERRVRLADEALAVAREGAAAAQERLDAGAAALLELNTARVEVGRMTRNRAEAGRRSLEARANLQLLLGVAPAGDLRLAGELEAGTGEEPDPERLTERALATRAEIAASRSALEAAQAEARLASRGRIPTPRVGVNLTREEESDTEIVQARVSFGIPLFDRNQVAIGVAAARVEQAEAELAAVSRRVHLEVSTAVARLRAARTAAEGFASDVAKAMEENMELGTESYRAGKIDFLELLLIRRQAVEARGEQIDVLEELHVARAQLERAIGGRP